MTAPRSQRESRLVVLDLDGTLARLEVDWERVRSQMKGALAAHGLPWAGGVGATLAAREASGAREPARQCEAIVADAELLAARTAPINRALLRWLQQRAPDARLAILTLNDRGAALAVRARLSLAERLDPEDVVGRAQAPPKPDPRGLLGLLRRHRLHPDEALLVGDSDADRECALAAGVAMIDVAAIGTEWSSDLSATGAVAAAIVAPRQDRPTRGDYRADRT